MIHASINLFIFNVLTIIVYSTYFQTLLEIITEAKFIINIDETMIIIEKIKENSIIKFVVIINFNLLFRTEYH